MHMCFFWHFGILHGRFVLLPENLQRVIPFPDPASRQPCTCIPNFIPALCFGLCPIWPTFEQEDSVLREPTLVSAAEELRFCRHSVAIFRHETGCVRLVSLAFKGRLQAFFFVIRARKPAASSRCTRRPQRRDGRFCNSGDV